MMETTERLERLANEGDKEAARNLLSRRMREGDAFVQVWGGVKPLEVVPDFVFMVNGQLRFRAHSGSFSTPVYTADEAVVVESKISDEEKRQAEQARKSCEEFEARIKEQRERWASLSIQGRIDEVNGRRRTRVLDFADLKRTIIRVAQSPSSQIGTAAVVKPDNLVWSNSYDYRAVSTIAVVVRVSRGVVVDVGESGGEGRIGSVPGWVIDERDVQGKGTPRLMSWAQEPVRVKLSLQAARNLA